MKEIGKHSKCLCYIPGLSVSSVILELKAVSGSFVTLPYSVPNETESVKTRVRESCSVLQCRRDDMCAVFWLSRLK
jgi:hypothetical protein